MLFKNTRQRRRSKYTLHQDSCALTQPGQGYIIVRQPNEWGVRFAKRFVEYRQGPAAPVEFIIYLVLIFLRLLFYITMFIYCCLFCFNILLFIYIQNENCLYTINVYDTLKCLWYCLNVNTVIRAKNNKLRIKTIIITGIYRIPKV